MVLAPSSCDIAISDLATVTTSTLEKAARLVAETGGDKTGMQAVGRHAAACQPLGQARG